MPTTLEPLPNDPTVLREQLAASQAAVAARDAVIATRDTEIEQLRGRLCYREAELEKLKFELARLKRMRFGRASEKLDGQIEQLELLIEELETPTTTASPIATGEVTVRVVNGALQTDAVDTFEFEP